jgi:hypothetical protein
MPTIPSKAPNIKSMNSADILNVTRNELGGNYASQIPAVIKEGDELPNGRIATKADSLSSLRGIGEIMMNYQPLQNAFLNALVNRIARVIITSRLYENPWAGFKKGIMEYGETIEEIFVNLSKPYQYDPVVAESEVFKRRIPDVKAAFHSMNYQKFYPTTVSNDQLRQAFLSWQGITDLIGKIIEQVYTGANYDEFLVMKYMIAQIALKGQLYPVSVPTITADNARAVTTSMVNYAKKLTYMSSDYNYAGVKTYTDPEFLYIILTTDVESIFDVEVLALSFNMNKAELIGRQIGIDGFGIVDNERLAEIFADDPYTDFVPFTEAEINQLNTIAGLMVDESWFMIFDNYYNMTEIYNPQGLYWNYFYHVWKTFSVSPFSNAILFTTNTPAITSVTVSPSTATVVKGNSSQFTAAVVNTGFAPKEVIWTVEGGADAGTVISDNGLLSVSPNETATSLTVKATSSFDSTKSSSAAVTVNAS